MITEEEYKLFHKSMNEAYPDQPMTAEEARAACNNLARFINLLIEIDLAQKTTSEKPPEQ